MTCKWLGAVALMLAALVSGCESEPKPTAEQQQPDFGQKSGDQMKNMIGVPGPKGQMTKPGAAKQ